MSREMNAEKRTVEQTLQQAVANHQSGRLQKAEELYRDILQSHPYHPEANHNRGVLAVQMQQAEASLPYFMAALNADPTCEQYWLSAINALFQVGQLEAAQEVLTVAGQQGFQGNELDALAARLKDGVQTTGQPNADAFFKEEQPVSWSPQDDSKNPSPQEINTLAALFNEGRYTEAATLAQAMTERFPLHGFGWKALGTLFKQMGRNADALLPMQKSAALSPGDAEIHSNLGLTLHALGRLEEAELSYRRALKLKPDFVEAHYNLGGTLHDLGRLDEAEASYRQVLAIKPDFIRAHYNLGGILQKLNRLNEAEASYRRALAINPDFAEALNNLGITLQDLKRLDEAKTCYQQALDINPDYADAYYNLGSTFHELGRLDEAEASCRQAVQLKPDYAEAYYNLGRILHEQGRLDEAKASYRRALEIKPDYFDAHNNLGNILQDHGLLEEAELSYRQALEIKPDYAEAHNNLGNTLLSMKRLDEAELSCCRALEIKPDFAEAHNNLGNILKELGRLDAAELSYRQALVIKPDFAEVHCNLGVTLKELGRPDDAEISYRRVLQLKPNYADAHNNLGIALKELNRLDEAETSFRRALEIKPDFAEAHNNLGSTLMELGQLDEAEACFRHALEIKPDYAYAYNNFGNFLQKCGQLDHALTYFRRALEIKPDYVESHSNLIFSQDLMADKDAASLLEERVRWDAMHAAHLHQQLPHTNTPVPERRIRIGYVSADFREHSAPKAFGGMLTRYDRSQFEVFAYSNFKGKNDNLTELFRQNVTVWRNIVGLSDDAATKMIREDKIDILVDLSGHSAGNRLLVFARKPAPIQITAWGYAAGTGMRAMDVLFTDPVMVPPEDKQYFTEDVRYLPNALGAFFLDPFPNVTELPALSNGIVTFGSLNRLVKVSDETYRAWAQVLLAVPLSRLILKTVELNDVSTQERIMGYFTKAGVAADRIVMQGKTSWYEHMQAYHQIDIGLDPFPQGGGVTALEGLMMGIPIINLCGSTLVGRVSASIMTTLGLSDWIAKNSEEYVDLAIRKTADLHSLATLRQQLRSIFSSSMLGDQTAYTQAVEQEYRKLWQEWCVHV